MYNVHSIL